MDRALGRTSVAALVVHKHQHQAVTSARLARISARDIRKNFSDLLATGTKLKAAGEAKTSIQSLLRPRYLPTAKLDIFDTEIFLSRAFQNPALRFMVAYVHHKDDPHIYPRIFYKDISLIWRAASHMIATGDDFWIGKGDVITKRHAGFELIESHESTTDLPFEICDALEKQNRSKDKVLFDEEALFLCLRSAPASRIAAYADFVSPRRKAQSQRSRLINRGRSIARFTKKNDPTSLVFVDGFEPNFKHGLVDVTQLRSKTFGGRVHRFRFLSKNREIQYMFMAARKHVWIIPPQTLEPQISTYGVRLVDVKADEDLFIPGYEYHYVDPDVHRSEHFSQIPKGFVGEQCPYDSSRHDASPWLEQLPIIRKFREAMKR